MRDILTVLFPYLVLLYLFDCVVRVRSGHLVFLSHLGRRFRAAGEGAHAVGLLPTSQAVLSHNIPLLLSAGGVHLPAAEARWDRPLRQGDLRFLPWGEIVSAAAEGENVVVNGTLSVALPTEAAAAAAASAIRDLATSPPALRREKAEALVTASYDLGAVAGVRESIRAPLLRVAIMSSLLFVCLYALLPLALFARAFQGRSLAPLLLAMAVAYVLAVAGACAVRRAIDPRATPGRAQLVVLLLLVPPGAAHVLGQLTRNLFARFDHLAVAAALAPPADFRRMARKELARFAFSETSSGEGDLDAALRTRERAARRLLAQAGLDADGLLAPPQRQSAESERYCPACEVEYLAGVDRCADCGIRLEEFGGTTGSAAKKPLARNPAAGKMGISSGA